VFSQNLFFDIKYNSPNLIRGDFMLKKRENKLYEIKKGDIVTRKSYGHDIIFVVKKVIKANDNDIAILKGCTLRIEASSPVSDLIKVDKNEFQKAMNHLEYRIENRIREEVKNRRSNSKITLGTKEYIYTGKILHLDGDRKYSEKAVKYYRKMGLNAVVKNISENKQPFLIQSLLERYKPDILVITGHDGMIKKGVGFNDIYNYRNSKYFIEAVKQARIWDKDRKLVIFAGACQSFFEAIMSAGANFASSPARVLIDFIDPLIIAEKVATTDKYKFIRIEDIEKDLRDGRRGIGGVGANGKKSVIFL